jgi:DNA-binding IclR family transcriptional regulator
MPSLQNSGVHNLSFPVMDVRGRAVGAMTLPFLLRTDVVSTLDAARDILRAAAAELSARLGHTVAADSP